MYSNNQKDTFVFYIADKPRHINVLYKWRKLHKIRMYGIVYLTKKEYIQIS